jgi:hypothetical protein
VSATVNEDELVLTFAVGFVNDTMQNEAGVVRNLTSNAELGVQD